MTDTALTAQQLGSLLSKLTRRIDATCLQCHTLMPDVTVRRAFCSARCRQKHWRTRLYNLRPGEPMTYVTGHRPAPTPDGAPDGVAE